LALSSKTLRNVFVRLSGYRLSAIGYRLSAIGYRLSAIGYRLYSPMSAIVQSVSWWCFVPEKLAPKEFIRAAADAGYVALDLVPPDFFSLVLEHGLKIAAITGHESLTVGLNKRDQHGRIKKEVEAKLADAVRHGIPNLICFTGNRDGLGDDEGAEITAEGLALLAPLAEREGITLILELLNSKIDHPDYQADHTTWGVSVCRKVNSPRVKLLYDIYHMQITEGDVIRTIETAHPWIAHYHTAGNPGRNDLDDDQELNYPAILRAIKGTGYSGYVAHEFIPKGDAVAALQTTFRKCALILE
jgi:hydroxypyruvate isomerase